MKITIDVTIEDALAIRNWLTYQINKEIMNEISPRNHVLLFATLIKDSIDKEFIKTREQSQ